MQGKRIYPKEGKSLSFASGDYGKDIDDIWRARPPKGHTGSLENHDVIEHEDGTITVSPSILISDGIESWHGFLERGIWRE